MSVVFDQSDENEMVFVAWPAGTREIDGHVYRSYRVRWSHLCHVRMGEPYAMQPTFADVPGQVVVQMKACDDVRRGETYRVHRKKNKRTGFWYDCTVTIDAKANPEAAAMLPDYLRRQSEAKFCVNIANPVTGASLTVQLYADPKPDEVQEAPPKDASDDQPQLPMTTDTEAASCDRQAWASVKLQRKHTEAALADMEHGQRHREQHADAMAQAHRNNAEFQAQILRDSKHQTQALESIATSLVRISDSGGVALVASLPERLHDQIENLTNCIFNKDNG